MEKDASAQQEKRILEAQAEAESIKLRGESRAFAIEARAKVISQKSYDSYFMNGAHLSLSSLGRKGTVNNTVSRTQTHAVSWIRLYVFSSFISRESSM